MTTLREIMTREVVTLEPEMTLREAVEIFRNHRISGAPVVSGRQVVGVVSQTDLLDFQTEAGGVPVQGPGSAGWSDWGDPRTEGADPARMASEYYLQLWADSSADVFERLDHPDGPDWDVLEDHWVGQVMTPGVVFLGPDASVREAARLMVRSGIHRLLVLEDGLLEGIVSTMDLVRALADGRIGS